MSWDDEDGASGVLRDLVAGAAEQELSKSTCPSTSDDHQVGLFALADGEQYRHGRPIQAEEPVRHATRGPARAPLAFEQSPQFVQVGMAGHGPPFAQKG